MGLRQRERFYIENNNCVNKVIPTREEFNVDNPNANIEYRLKNKEAIKQWFLDNKIKVSMYKAEYARINKFDLARNSAEYRANNKEK
jgi:hypothetical protein